MGKVVKQVVVCTCDICGGVCDEDDNRIDRIVGTDPSGQHQTRLIGRFHVYIPYGTDNGLVCKKCLKKHLRIWLANENTYSEGFFDKSQKID